MICKHFTKCGGCTRQNIPYETQAQEKEAFVLNLFKEYITDETQILPILASQDPWHYRSKMEFTFSEQKEEKRLGLFQSKGQVISLEECLISPPWFIEVLKKAKAWWEKTQLRSYYPPRDRGSLRTLTLREPNCVILTVSGHKDYLLSDEDIISFKEAMPSHLSVILIEQILEKKQPTRFNERVLQGEDHLMLSLEVQGQPLFFKVKPRAFFQPNFKMVSALYQEALNRVGIHKEMIVYDLFSGTGTLGMFASFFAKKVYSIELNSECVQSARENLLLNQITNMELLEGDVGKILSTLPEMPDLVMVDPPRVGLDHVAMQYLIEKKVPLILYISCNPLSQAENAKMFIENGYKLLNLRPIDQFPHTNHVENIAIFKLI